MPTLRRHLRRLTWIALLAMLGLALAPALSHAASAAGPSSEICSTAGAGASDAPAPADAALHVQHCALCAAHAHADGLPPGDPPSWAAADGAAFVSTLAAVAPPLRLAWTAAPARAPPAGER